MKKRAIISRLIVLALVLCMVLSISPVTLAATDDVAGHWSEQVVEKCYSYGIMNGDGSGNTRPDDYITRAEFVKMVNTAFGFTKTTGAQTFVDVEAGTWYETHIAIASAMSYMKGYGNGTVLPDGYITREEAFTILARVYKLFGSETAKTNFSDDAQISDWARASIAGLVQSGYVSGYDGKLWPKDPLTRGQTAQILMNLIGEIADDDAQDVIYGNLTIREPGVTLKNAVIKGDLYITEGVGDGEVYFDNVTVEGRTYVAGGGENSLYFINCDIKEFVVSKTQVRIVLSDGTVVEFARALSGDSVFEVYGNTKIENLTIIGEGVTVKVSGNATIGTLNADAGNTNVSVASGSSIGTANLNGETNITGSGSIGTANINVNGCDIAQTPGTTNTQPGINANVGGGNVGTPPSGGSPVYASHNAPNKTDVRFGTTFAELDLPATVTLYATTGVTATASVTWNSATYNPNLSGAQTVTGTLSGTLPSWAPATISVTVTVRTPVPTTIQITTGASSIEKGNTSSYSVIVRDQYGEIMSTYPTLTWSVDVAAAAAGVTVSTSGVVSVPAGCTATQLTLRVDCGSLFDTKVMQIVAQTVTPPTTTSPPPPVTSASISYNNGDDFFTLTFTEPTTDHNLINGYFLICRLSGQWTANQYSISPTTPGAVRTVIVPLQSLLNTFMESASSFPIIYNLELFSKGSGLSNYSAPFGFAERIFRMPDAGLNAMATGLKFQGLNGTDYIFKVSCAATYIGSANWYRVVFSIVRNSDSQLLFTGGVADPDTLLISIPAIMLDGINIEDTHAQVFLGNLFSANKVGSDIYCYGGYRWGFGTSIPITP